MSKLVEVPSDVHKRLKYASLDLNMELREIAKEAMDDWLKKHGRPLPREREDEVPQPA